eukprot:1050246-Pelagomonas_calceolata.AAC.6
MARLHRASCEKQSCRQQEEADSPRPGERGHILPSIVPIQFLCIGCIVWTVKHISTTENQCTSCKPIWTVRRRLQSSTVWPDPARLPKYRTGRHHRLAQAPYVQAPYSGFHRNHV